MSADTRHVFSETTEIRLALKTIIEKLDKIIELLESQKGMTYLEYKERYYPGHSSDDSEFRPDEVIW